MRILALDTAGRGCSVGLWADGVALAVDSQPMAHGQAETLIPQIGALLDAQGASWQSLDRLTVTIGPGSFTGLRVGLAAVQGLALASGLPIVGLTTLDVFAHHAVATCCTSPQQGPRLVIAVVDARRDDVYLQPFIRHQDGSLCPLEDPASLPIANFSERLEAWQSRVGGTVPALLCGDALALIDTQCASAERFDSPCPDVMTLAVLAAQRTPEDCPPRPLYIRPPDAALPVNGGQIRPLATRA